MYLKSMAKHALGHDDLHLLSIQDKNTQSHTADYLDSNLHTIFIVVHKHIIKIY